MGGAVVHTPVRKKVLPENDFLEDAVLSFYSNKENLGLWPRSEFIGFAA